MLIVAQSSHGEKCFVPFIDSPKLFCSIERSSGKCLHHMHVAVVLTTSSAQGSGFSGFSQFLVPTELVS